MMGDANGAMAATHIEKVHNHVPLSTIADEVLREVSHKTVVDGEVGVLN